VSRLWMLQLDGRPLEPEARLNLVPAPADGYMLELVDSLPVRLGVPAGSLGVARRPVALELLPPASLTSSSPRRVLGATGLHHDCLRAAGWEVVLLPLEDWEHQHAHRAPTAAALSLAEALGLLTV